MAEAEGKRESNGASLKSLPRDLLQRINSRSHFTRRFEETAQEEEDDVELSLGLSLNGRFGVDPKKDSKLNRSSSIANLMTTEDCSALRLAPLAPYAPLTRTCSLPTEPEEEWRKRKELQSLRRMEAKRKRLEKLKSVKTARDQGNLEESGEENFRAENQGSVHIGGSAEFSSAFRKTTRVSGAVGAAVTAHGNESRGERANGLEGRPPQTSSQGSVVSRTTGSSVISELEAQPVQGMNKDTEARSPARVQTMHEQREQKPVLSTGETKEFSKIDGVVARNPPSSSEEVTATVEEANKMESKVTLNMPCVSTRGDGPNGKRIEGFLYKYKKGEEVSIVCVCHGSFLSPAEFVKHAGGTDVAHPLRHIVVNPSSLL